MAIDPRLSLQVESPDILSAAKQGQELGYTSAMAPVKAQAALTELESNQLKLKQEQNLEEFNNYLNTNPPVINAQGQVDIPATMSQMFTNGYGRYALGMAGDALKINASTVTNRSELLKVVRNVAIDVANGAKGLPPDQQKTIGEQAAKHLMSQYGVDIREIFGTEDWIRAAQGAQSTPLEASTEQRAEFQAGTTKENTDPNSQKSRDLRKFILDNYGVTLPTTLSYYDISQDSKYTKYVDSFLVDQQTRVGQAKDVATLSADKAKLTDLRNTMQTGEITRNIWWKPFEKISNIVKTIKNDADRAKIQQLVNESKALGIEIDADTTFAGVIEAIDRKIGTLSEKQTGAKKLATSSNVKQAVEGTRTNTYAGKDGQVYIFTDEELSNPTVQAAIKNGFLRK